MAVLPVVLWGGLSLAERFADTRSALLSALPKLQRTTDAFYALLSVVPKESTASMAGSAVPGNMRALRLVGRFDLLELLSVVRTEPDDKIRFAIDEQDGGCCSGEIGTAVGGGQRCGQGAR